MKVLALGILFTCQPDQGRADIDADHLMPESLEIATKPPFSAAYIHSEHAGFGQKGEELVAVKLPV